MSADDLNDELYDLAGGDGKVDVEEGEASSLAASSPNSLGSDAMDESDSDRDDDADLPPADFSYPLEGKYLNEADKRRIMAMSQLEREEILGGRAEEMSKANFQAELARRAAANQYNDRKRKADSDEPDDSMRKSNRPKVQPRKNDKLEAYKREREQRGQQRQRQDARRNRIRRSISAERDGSDIDADGESDVDWDERATKQAREEQPATLRDIESVRVGRGFFSEVCFHPGFEQAMTGTFGRIGVGQDSQRQTLYKMMQIKGFTAGKPYVFEGKNGHRVATDQYVTAAHGSNKKDYQFQFLSNQRFSDSDMDAFRKALSESNAKLPSQAFLQRKYDDLKQLSNHYWTDADISARLIKSKRYAHLLTRGADNAQPRIATQSEQAAAQIAELNRRNRATEAERIRKAQLDQQRQKKLEQKREFARRKAEDDAMRSQEKAAVYKKNLEVDALFDSDANSRASTPRPDGKKKSERKGLPTFRKPKMDDEILASMDIGMDIEI